MKNKKYSIFGAGASGLYTAWRLLNGQPAKKGDQGKLLSKGDVLELYDWGKYDFSKANPGTRPAGARVCTHHYKNDKKNSFVELGGMRYADWNGKDGGENQGHRLVTTVIELLGLKKYSVPFNAATNPLYYLRTKNFYLNDVTSNNPAPYNVAGYGGAVSPDTGFTLLQDLAVSQEQATNMTRRQWCEFYKKGTITVDLPAGSVFQKGDKMTDIGYWDLMFDQLGPEGFAYTADGNGYTSNIINWNSADAIQANNEFNPGAEYHTLTTGYSSVFNALFDAILALSKKKGVNFKYYPNTRLHSILQIDKVIHYWTATRENPNKKSGESTTDAAWLAMPRYALDLVAQATRYQEHKGLDVLNHKKVQLYLESAILQPSYKVGMFFSSPWWLASNNPAPNYPAPIEAYEVTDDVLAQLAAKGFPKKYINAIRAAQNPAILETPYTPKSAFIQVVEQCIQQRLTVKEENQLAELSQRNTMGPTITDTPIRMIVYFGNNAADQTQKPVYGILASYDDEQFTTFWQELEIGPDGQRKVALSENYQPLDGPRKAPEVMVKMLRKQMAAVHFGPQADYTAVPEPLETTYMDWSLPPFNAGYHVFAAHYDMCDVQQKIRKPSQLIPGADANIFIVGETYSNDQAWMEGAYCTAESVLNDFFGVKPLIDDKNYPFICPC